MRLGDFEICEIKVSCVFHKVEDTPTHFSSPKFLALLPMQSFLARICSVELYEAIGLFDCNLCQLAIAVKDVEDVALRDFLCGQIACSHKLANVCDLAGMRHLTYEQSRASRKDVPKTVSYISPLILEESIVLFLNSVRPRCFCIISSIISRDLTAVLI